MGQVKSRGVEGTATGCKIDYKDVLYNTENITNILQ